MGISRLATSVALNKSTSIYSKCYNQGMQILTYEYKLEPTTEQNQAFEQWLEICRKVYNYALRERKDWVNSRKCQVNACSLKQEYILPADAPRLTFHRQCKSLAAAKETNPDLKIPHTHVLQQVLRTLEAAFVAMWERGHGFPRFKKRLRSFVYPQLNKVPVKGDRVNLPKIGWVKMRLSRPLPQGYELKQVRVVKQASGFYAMLTLQSAVEVPQPMPSGHAVGIDLGLQQFLATSEGELIARPQFFVDGQRKLKSLQRQLKRKTRGSRESQRLHRRIAQHHEYISNARKDFHFKTAHHLCDSAGMVFAEDLNLKAMSAGMLCKHTLDAGFGQFLSILEHVCFKRGAYFAKVNANGTSQTCPNCQTHTGKKELSERVHKCPECGYETNRDVAAAQIVLQRGYTAVGHTAVKLDEGKVSGLPSIQESPSFAKSSVS
jgi:putative transposase